MYFIVGEDQQENDEMEKSSNSSPGGLVEFCQQ